MVTDFVTAIPSVWTILIECLPPHILKFLLKYSFLEKPSLTILFKMDSPPQAFVPHHSSFIFLRRIYLHTVFLSFVYSLSPLHCKLQKRRDSSLFGLLLYSNS